MAPARLKMALPDGVAPETWYRHLNGLVFMWAEETRLVGLLKARFYRNLEHDVLTKEPAARAVEQRHLARCTGDFAGHLSANGTR